MQYRTALIILTCVVTVPMGCISTHRSRDASAARVAGWERYRVRDFAGAVERFDEAIRLDPDRAVAWNNRGCAHLQAGAIESARADFTEAIRLDPSDAHLHNNLGTALHDLGRYEQAKAAYDVAIELDATVGRFLTNRALSLRRLQRFTAARRDYDAALRIDPLHAGAFSGRAAVRRAQGDAVGALSDEARCRAIQSEPAELIKKL